MQYLVSRPCYHNEDPEVWKTAVVAASGASAAATCCSELHRQNVGLSPAKSPVCCSLALGCGHSKSILCLLGIPAGVLSMKLMKKNHILSRIQVTESSNTVLSFLVSEILKLTRRDWKGCQNLVDNI